MKLQQIALTDDLAAAFRALDALPMTTFNALLETTRAELAQLPAESLIVEYDFCELCRRYGTQQHITRILEMPQPARVVYGPALRSTRKKSLLAQLPGAAVIEYVDAGWPRRTGVMALAAAQRLAAVVAGAVQ